MNIDVLVINGTEYVPKGSKRDAGSYFAPAPELDGMKYVIVRTYSAGVFAGYLEKRKGKEVIMRHARRLWQWFGASSLSELAVKGVADPGQCKFPCEVDRIELLQAIEIIECTEKAKNSITSVPEWKQHN